MKKYFIFILGIMLIISIVSADIPKVIITPPTNSLTSTTVVINGTAIGTCPAGYAVQNLTGTTLQCIQMPVYSGSTYNATYDSKISMSYNNLLRDNTTTQNASLYNLSVTNLFSPTTINWTYNGDHEIMGTNDASLFYVGSWANASGSIWNLLGSGADFSHLYFTHNVPTNSSNGSFMNASDYTSTSYVYTFTDNGFIKVFVAKPQASVGVPTFNAVPTYVLDMMNGTIGIVNINFSGDLYSNDSSFLFNGTNHNLNINGSLNITSNLQVGSYEGIGINPTSNLHIQGNASDFTLVNIDGSTVPQTVQSTTPTGLKLTKTNNINASSISSTTYGVILTTRDQHILNGSAAVPGQTIFGIQNLVQSVASHTIHSNVATFIDDVEGTFNSVTKSGTLSADWYTSTIYGSRNQVTDQITYDNLTTTHPASFTDVGLQNVVSSPKNIANSQQNVSITLRGIYNQISSSLGGASAENSTTNFYGTYNTIAGYTQGVTTAYGDYSQITAGGDTNWIYYAGGTIGNNYLGGNNIKTYFGNSQASSIYYNGSDLLINPKEVGSGNIYLQGTTLVNGDVNSTNMNVSATLNAGTIHDQQLVNGNVVIQSGGVLATNSGLTYNAVTHNVTAGNVTVTNLLSLASMTLPTCSSTWNGSIGRNDTKIYFCDGTIWQGLY